MNKKICVTSTRSVGCTFVDWSLHFLSGQHSHYHTKSQTSIALIHNPLTPLNAHGYKKNHPAGSKNFLHDLDLFDLQSTNAVCSTYPFPIEYDLALDHLGYTGAQLSDPTVLTAVNQWILQDYNCLFALCQTRDTKMIFVSTDPNTVLYHQHIRIGPQFLLSQNTPVAAAEIKQEFQEIFFPSSAANWTALNLSNIWDQRERMALDVRPFDLPPCNQLDFKQPHFWIGCQQLWQQPEKTLTKILDYCELNTDQTRLRLWRPIAHQWQQLQLQCLEFGLVYKHIVDATVNNWDYTIDLSFDQEVIIQHCLIYQHNLNLKTWQLHKFPNNTQALHQLLESNAHPVNCIY